MNVNKHKVFISYHHKNDQIYKEGLITFNKRAEIFIDGSVHADEIDDSLPDETIRRIIRDEYLRDTTVTILLVGKETKYRKHIDWELYSSMYDGPINKKSGILVILLPGSVFADIPQRIIDNINNPNNKIDVINWGQINEKTLTHYINKAFLSKSSNDYDLSLPMRKINGSSKTVSKYFPY